MSYRRIKERTTAVLSLTFRNSDGALEAPQSISYRVDCIDTQQQIRDWTPITPSLDQVEIELTPTDNACFVPAKPLERHVVTIQALYNGDQELNDKYIYEVENLKFL